MEAEIITIGDELLLGQTVNTNAAWMGGECMQRGIAVRRVTSISDRATEITRALEDALGRVDLVIMTGGLGPTRDDVTKHTLAEYFGMTLVLDEAVLKRITEWFAGRGLGMLPSNVDQARLPDGCTVLPNPLGTAMGMWFDVERAGIAQAVISLPGVPYEMKGLMVEEVFPRIQHRWQLPLRYHRTVLTQGVGESFLSEQVQDWEAELEGRGISIAYLPAPGQVRVRLSAVGADAARRVDSALDDFMARAGEHVVAMDDVPLEAALVEALVRAQATVATAESCTGGSIASRITSVAGASAVFEGGVVAYANDVKIQLLGVRTESLQRHGAVSESVVREMAEGARSAMGATFGLATSGIAGPTGGTPEKPVGTIWIALATPSGTEARCLHLGNHRGRNVQRTVLECMAWLVRYLNDAEKRGEKLA